MNVFVTREHACQLLNPYPIHAIIMQHIFQLYEYVKGLGQGHMKIKRLVIRMNPLVTRNAWWYESYPLKCSNYAVEKMLSGLTLYNHILCGYSDKILNSI